MLNEYKAPLNTESSAKNSVAEYAAETLVDELLFLVTKFRHDNKNMQADMLDLAVVIAMDKVKGITQSSDTQQLTLSV